MAGEGRSVQLAARVLHTSESGYYRWKKHTASARSLRHAFLTEIIGMLTPVEYELRSPNLRTVA